MSFYLFALLARLYAPPITADCYFFLFIFGFLAAALRMAANINASVSALRTRAANLRCIQRANCISMLCALAVAPLGAVLLQPHTGSPWLLAFALIILVSASIDFDMPRALLGKGPLFPVAFAIGSSMAVGLLALAPHRPQSLAIAALLAQWVPAGLLGVRSLLRAGWRPLKVSLRQITREAMPLIWVLAVALFDGLILNAPFFLGSSQPDSARIDVSIVMRVFSAALLFSPLLLHWSNSPVLGKPAQLFGLSPEKAHLILHMVLSCSSAVAFMAAYTLVSGQPVRSDHALAVAALLVAYSFYATASRHQGNRRPTTRQALLCAILLVSFFVLASTMPPSLGILRLSLLQGSALLLGTWLLRQSRRK